MDLAGFHQVYVETMRDAPYLKCFTRLVRDAANSAVAFNKQLETPITKLEFTFDNRPEVEFSAARLYSACLNEPGWESASLLASKVSFECRTNPRIQMADMIARECMKDLDRVVGPIAFPERRSKIALAENNKFRFFTLRKKDFEEEQIKNAQLELDGFSQQAYREWLWIKGAQDTWDNRVRFSEDFDRRQRH